MVFGKQTRVFSATRWTGVKRREEGNNERARTGFILGTDSQP